MLDWYRGISTQSKLYIDLTEDLDLSYGFYFNNDHSYGVSGATTFKYVPDAGRHYYTNRYTHILSATYVFSRSTFLDLKGSYYKNDHENYAYQNPYDYRYMPTQPGDFEQYVFAPGPDDNISISSKPKMTLPIGATMPTALIRIRAITRLIWT
ncbi:MAG: hypothetical protein U5R06_03245 [candidate division KSB1 bacterium]|nr:hypothetical protein [candidate division KSB1 bacterium]